MEFARINKDKIISMYDQGMSSYQIATELKTYSTKVLRALTFLGVERRDGSEAQKNALKSGRSSHPTQGKKLTESHLKKIGKGRAEAYKKLTPEEKAALVQMGKDTWAAIPDSKKDEIRRLALESIRESSKIGSKTERHVHKELTKRGFKVEFHKTNILPGSKLEVDMYIPECRTALEIDGPGHFLPLWGEEKLAKQQSSDVVKQGALLQAGINILRVRQLDKSISMTNMDSLLAGVLAELESIYKSDRKKATLIEIEVKDGETRRV